MPGPAHRRHQTRHKDRHEIKGTERARKVLTPKVRGVDPGTGTTYLDTSAFLGRKTQLTYIVSEFIRGKSIRRRGENKIVIAVDTTTFRSVDVATDVTYTADFTVKGLARLVAPLLRPAFERLGAEAQTNSDQPGRPCTAHRLSRALTVNSPGDRT
jgi:hypothetical protein